MADIREFGASLLADVRKRNDNLYKKQRNEAYKMALLQTGVGMINSTVQNRAAEFLNSEAAMAARVKQRRGVDDAQFFIDQQERIDLGGVSAVEYFESQMMPYASEVAKEHLQDRYVPETYEPWIRQQVRQLAEQRAQWHQQGFEAANQLSSPEDFAAFQAIQAAKEKSAFDWVTGSIKRAFSGKTRADADRETIDIISNSPEIQRAETVTALRRAFNQTGSLELSAKVAAAIESGTIKEVPDSIKVSQIPGVQTVKDALGNESSFIGYHLTDSSGNIQVDSKGVPVIIKNWISGGPSDGNLTGGNVRLSQVMEQVTPSEISLQDSSMRAHFNSLPEKDQQIFNTYLIQAGYMDDEGNLDKAPFMRKLAAWSRINQEQHGLSEAEAQSLTSQIFMNRLKTGVSVQDPFLGIFGGRKVEFDWTQMNYDAIPDSIENILGIGNLEGTAREVSFDPQTLDSLISNAASDLSKYPPADRVAFIELVVQNQEQAILSGQRGSYEFLFERDPMGDSAIELLSRELMLDPQVRALVEPSQRFISEEEDVSPLTVEEVALSPIKNLEFQEAENLYDPLWVRVKREEHNLRTYLQKGGMYQYIEDLLKGNLHRMGLTTPAERTMLPLEITRPDYIENYLKD